MHEFYRKWYRKWNKEKRIKMQVAAMRVLSVKEKYA